jgi:hypothetical protein
LNPGVTPVIGSNSTVFTFTVWYFDADNNLPDLINITINGTGTFTMVENDSLDMVVFDGKLYQFSTTLPWGYYQFQASCFDGTFTNTSAWITGPEVNPFFDIPSWTTLIFHDDFEIGYLDSKWTLTGVGGVSTATSNSSPYSAYHANDAGAITSRIINLNGYSTVNVSYWVRRGGSFPGSEHPDMSPDEDFYVEYYDSTGTWIQLDRFLGGGPEGEIFAISHQFPSSALHSSFQIRFRQQGGSGSGFDYWHFDDVAIISCGASSSLVSPQNGSTVFIGPVDFTWTSHDSPDLGSINYTWQLASDADFLTITDEVTTIPETVKNTTLTRLVNHSPGPRHSRFSLKTTISRPC